MFLAVLNTMLLHNIGLTVTFWPKFLYQLNYHYIEICRCFECRYKETRSCSCILSLFVPDLFYFRCLEEAVLCACGFSWVFCLCLFLDNSIYILLVILFLSEQSNNYKRGLQYNCSACMVVSPVMGRLTTLFRDLVARRRVVPQSECQLPSKFVQMVVAVLSMSLVEPIVALLVIFFWLQIPIVSFI